MTKRNETKIPECVKVNGEYFDVDDTFAGRILNVNQTWGKTDEIFITIGIPACLVDLTGTKTIEEVCRAVIEQVEIKAFRRAAPRIGG
jgi:hypothetical protein